MERDPTTFLDLSRTGNGNNDRGLSYEPYDALLEQAANEIDPVARKAMLTEAALRWAQSTDNYHKVAARLQTEMLQSTLREQRPWVGWAGHSSRIGYHCAIISTFCQLYQTLPKNEKYDELRADLRRRVVAALNRMTVLSLLFRH